MLSPKLDDAIDSGLYDWDGFNTDIVELIQAEFLIRKSTKKKRNIKQLTNVVRKLLETRKLNEFDKVSKTISKEQTNGYNEFVQPLIDYYGNKNTSMQTVDTELLEKDAIKQCAKLASKIYYTVNRMEREYEQKIKRLQTNNT